MKIFLKDAETGLWLGESGGWEIISRHRLEFATSHEAIEHSKSCGRAEVNLCFVFDDAADDFEIGSQRRWLRSDNPVGGR
jgi:hypothetical protein